MGFFQDSRLTIYQMEAPRYWRANQQRYRLTGSICSNCNEPSFPPRDICPHCDGKSQTQYAQRGEVRPLVHDLIETDLIEEKMKEYKDIRQETVVYQAST